MANTKKPLQVAELTCVICKHKWLPRYADLPLCCPRCRRADWRTGKGPRSLETVKLILKRERQAA